MNIDLRTLAVILGLTAVIQVIALYLQYLLNKTYRGIGWWLLWSASTAAGFICMLLRDVVPVGLVSVSIFFTNVLLLAGQIFLYIGIMRFLVKKENRGIIIAVSAVFILSTFYVLYVNKDDNARTLIFYAAVAIFLFLAAQGLFVNKARSFTASANFICAILFTQGCYFALRSVTAATIAPMDSVFTPTLIQTASFLVSLIAGALCTFGLIIMVSQRSNAEMREAKEQFELIFNTSPDASLITRPEDGLIVNINEGFTALTGFTRDEAIGKSSLDVNLWKDPADRQNVVNELGKKGFCDNYEAIFQLKDGSQIYGTMSTKIITLQGVQHIISVTRDITERKRAEEALARSEEKYRTILENMHDSYIEVDIAGNFTFINEATCRNLGFTIEELIGQSFGKIAPDQDGIRDIFKVYNEVYKTGEPHTGFAFKVMRKDGSTGYAETSISLIKNAQGMPIGFRSVGRDVTERKQMEQKLMELATHDGLTGLANRALLYDRFGIAMANAQRNKKKIAVMTLDLDLFKYVNDTLGHDIGDRVLIAVAGRLTGALRKSDTVARMGGDEFVLLLWEIDDKDAAVIVAEKILKDFRQPFISDGHSLKVTVSIGIAIYPENGENMEELLKCSDKLLYTAKQNGGDKFAI